MFGPAELAALILFALVVVSNSGTGYQVKGLTSSAIGIFLASVGLDPMTGQRRLTFDVLELDAGIPLLPMLIGLLVVSEILTQIRNGWEDAADQETPLTTDASANRLTFQDIRQVFGTVVRCSFIGSMCGALPGVGSITAAFMGYNHAKSFSKEPKCFGQGDIRGVAGPEAANNAVCGAGLIPLVTLGIPGALTAAVIMGAFMIHGLAPGPMLMTEQPEMIYGLFLLLLVSDVLMIFVALPAIAVAQRVMTVSRRQLYAVVLVLCIIGAYATNQNIFDVKVMVCFGIFGYLIKAWGLSPPALLIAFILGPMAEVNLRQALEISNGSIAIFASKPISAVFLALALATILWSATAGNRRRLSLRTEN